ncbi:hypothetical protein J6590_073272 [Homalodisca vitripennis]|nr:hypothetical protein J6590_073272 [Homalodisca vitripennis]
MEVLVCQSCRCAFVAASVDPQNSSVQGPSGTQSMMVTAALQSTIRLVVKLPRMEIPEPL